MHKSKTAKQLERHMKGIANHRRIEILFLVANINNITLDNIADRLHCNLKTISEHTRRLVLAGLINKNYKGRFVEHSLSSYGRVLYKLITTFSHS